MCKVYEGCKVVYTPDYIMSIIDEVASAAASMSQGGHSYDSFIKSRDRCQSVLNEYNTYITTVQERVVNLLEVV